MLKRAREERVNSFILVYQIIRLSVWTSPCEIFSGPFGDILYRACFQRLQLM